MNREERMEQHPVGEGAQRAAAGEPPEPSAPGTPPAAHGEGPHASPGHRQGPPTSAQYAAPSGWTEPGGRYGGGMQGANAGETGVGHSSGGYGAQGAAGQGYAGYAPFGYGPGALPPFPNHGMPPGQHNRGPEPSRDVPPHQWPGPFPRPPQPGQDPYRGDAPPPYGGQGYGSQGFGAPGHHPPPQHGVPPVAPGYGGASYGSQAYGGWESPGALQHEAQRPAPMRHRRGPKGYTRTDQRLLEEICDRMVQQVEIDPGDVEVRVREGVVELEGSVESRAEKHRVEDLVDSVWGVKDIRNNLRVGRPGHGDVPLGGQQNK